MVPIGRPERGRLDDVALEEPLEIRIAGEAVATTMRTPGDDRQLALGFLLAEGIVTSLDDVGGLAHCGRPGDAGYGNVIDVTPGPGTSLDIERIGGSRRGTLTTAACGVCGRRTIDDLLQRCRVQSDPVTFAPSLLAASLDRMRNEQALFAKTGGVHAAAAIDRTGAPLALFEDIGRHNAVDKVVGQLMLDGRLPARGLALLVSGRASFEVVQKALAARIAVVVSVSAASSLAIDLACRTDTTLVAFARGQQMNVYGRTERIGG